MRSQRVGFSAILIINWVSVLPILVINRVWFLNTLVLNCGGSRNFTNTNLKTKDFLTVVIIGLKHCLSVVLRPKVSIRKAITVVQYW